MIAVDFKRGYPETQVVVVVGIAGLLRKKAFYELFSSGEECLSASYDALLGTLLGDTARGFGSKPGPPGSSASPRPPARIALPFLGPARAPASGSRLRSALRTKRGGQTAASLIAPFRPEI